MVCRLQAGLVFLHQRPQPIPDRRAKPGAGVRPRTGAEAFEKGVLEDYADALKSARSPVTRERLLADLVTSRS